MASAAIAGKKPKKFTYEWEGKDKKGSRVSGFIDSVSHNLVKARLRREGITPLKVRKKTKSHFSGANDKITPQDISIFARQLTTMMSAGVPLVQAFEIVASSLDNKAMRALVLAVKTDVESGSGLAVAMRKHPAAFDDLFCNLVAAGEQSGTLEKLLNEIATYKEKSEALKSKIKKAMFYPIAVLVVAFVVTAILLIFVVPQFESLFKGMGSDLPAFTQMVVGYSEMALLEFTAVIETPEKPKKQKKEKKAKEGKPEVAPEQAQKKDEAPEKKAKGDKKESEKKGGFLGTLRKFLKGDE